MPALDSDPADSGPRGETPLTAGEVIAGHGPGVASTPWGSPPAPSRASSRPWVLLAIAVSLLLVGELAIAAWALARVHPVRQARLAQSQVVTVPQVTVPSGSAGSGERGASSGSASTQLDAQAIANRVEPAVVDITTVVATLGQPARAAGTGIVLTSSGEVLTNHHVVQGATSIEIAIANRPGTFTASVVGVDIPADVALLQIQGVSGLPTANLADASNLRIGQPVVAIGNALGRAAPRASPRA